jgi:heptosyltransferase-2
MKPRLLIFELRMMGDAIMALPFVRAALEKYDVWVCCTPIAAEVFRLVLPAEQIVEWTPPWLVETGKYKWSRWQNSGIRSVVKKLRTIRADTAVSVWADSRVHILMTLSGARQRIGFPMASQNYYAHQAPWRRRQLQLGRALAMGSSLLLLRPLLTRPIDRVSYFQHHVEDWRQLGEVLDLNWDASAPWLVPRVQPLAPHIRHLIDQAHSRNEKVWLIHAGARTPGKRWPVEKFGRVISEIFLTRKIPFVWLESPEAEVDDSFLTESVHCKAENVADLFNILQAVDRVVCNDTGVGHAAAALNKRVVAVFSSGLPQWFAPYDNLDLVADREVCPHRPCLDRCVMPSYICLEAVTFELVRAKIEKLLHE